MCPTAPDTLRVYPFKDQDPFVISKGQGSHLELESQVESTQQHQNSGVTATGSRGSPHVYFAGNMLDYRTELLQKGKQAKNGFIKVICIPSFVKTQAIVLLDLQTMESYEVKFGISSELFKQY